MENEMSKEEQRKLRNEYFRNWRKENPEKVQKINERFYRKKIEQLNQIEQLDLQKGKD